MTDSNAGTKEATDIDRIFKQMEMATETAIDIKDMAYSLHRPVEKQSPKGAETEAGEPAIGEKMLLRLYNLNSVLNDARAALRNYG